MYGELMSVDSDIGGTVNPFEHSTIPRAPDLSAQAIPYILSGIDAFAILLCSLVAALAYHLAVRNSSLDLTPHIAVGLVAGFFYVLRMNGSAFYNFFKTATPRVEIQEILVRWFTTGLLLALVAFLLKAGEAFSRGTFITFCFLTPVALVGLRKFLKIVLAEAISKGVIGRRDTVILGEFNEMLALKPRELLAVCGASQVNRFALSKEVDPEIRNADDQRTINYLADFVRLHDCRQILLALPWSDTDRIEFVRDQIKALPVAARLLPDSRARSLTNSKWSTCNSVLPIDVQRAPLSGEQRFVKRLVDVSVSCLALLFFIPIMLLTAIAIKLDSPGPVIFRQCRRGFNGKRFVIFKFRTMTVQENGATVVQAARKDSRVTSLGQLLRASSLDELPQLLNVLRGDMSLIGPRPHALAHDDYFESILGDYAFRHHVKPGITGWAQCNGARGATPSIEHISERVRLDLWYINNWSLWLDIHILIKTIFEVARRRNAY
jgi:Undecaprenyl-phosphate glucose phosphotransferase